MELAELNQAFYNLLGEFQAEKIFTDGLGAVVQSHAEDLDGFNKRTKETSAEVVDLELKHEQVKSIMENQFEAIKSEHVESIAHTHAMGWRRISATSRSC